MIRRVFLAAFALSIAVPSLSDAASICGARDRMVSNLTEKYGESGRGMGLSGPQAMVEIFSSKKTGTFTIVMTRPDGTACVLAAGDSWVEAPEEKGPET